MVVKGDLLSARHQVDIGRRLLGKNFYEKILTRETEQARSPPGGFTQANAQTNEIFSQFDPALALCPC